LYVSKPFVLSLKRQRFLARVPTRFEIAKPNDFTDGANFNPLVGNIPPFIPVVIIIIIIVVPPLPPREIDAGDGSRRGRSAHHVSSSFYVDKMEKQTIASSSQNTLGSAV